MVSVVIVDYKTPEESFKYIGRFAQAVKTDGNLHYVVVDNSGEECIRKYCEQQSIGMKEFEYSEDVYVVSIAQTDVYVVDSHGNLGYARGNNLGVCFSNDVWDDPRVIITNNDIYFSETIQLDAFEQVLREHPYIAVVGPMVRNMKTKDQQSPHSRMTYLAWTSRYWLFAIAPKLALKLDSPMHTRTSQRVYWVSGCFMYIDSVKFTQVGMFDSNTFLYWEEKILSERLNKYGYGMYFLADSTIYHNIGSTISSSVAVLESARFDIESALYYYAEYMGLGKLGQYLARISFNVYKFAYPVRQRIKHLLNR